MKTNGTGRIGCLRPQPLQLKEVLPFYARMSEQQARYAMFFV
jgi:hypothetical protein